MPSTSSTDLLIIGGGVIGLSVALKMADAGWSVRVLERQDFGREASWAGAGMIPPGEIHFTQQSYRKLAARSAQLWPNLSQELRERTGIDNEYRRCGAWILQEDNQSPAEFQQEQQQWQLQGVATHIRANTETPCPVPVDVAEAYWLPQQAQVRNPRHVKALLAACENAGVLLHRNEPVIEIKREANLIDQISTEQNCYTAGQVLLTAGSWSGQFEDLMSCSIPIQPLQGQIVLLQSDSPPPSIIEQGKRYLVPRRDGLVLIGSTEEAVGYEKKTAAETVQQLRHFAQHLFPDLENAVLVDAWSGLRPVSADRLPILGPMPGFENGWIATGHYRAGLSLSPITAQLMSDLLLEKEPEIDLSDFSLSRFLAEAADCS